MINVEGFGTCVCVEAHALEAYLYRLNGGGDGVDMFITWKDAVALRDMLSDQISLYQKDMTDEQEGEE